MIRWFGYTLRQVDEMLLIDVWMLDGFIARCPPLDLLVAWHLGYRQPDRQTEKGKPAKIDRREIAKHNAKELAKLPPRRGLRTLDQMPDFLRTPEKMKMLEETRRQWQTISE